MTVSPSELSCTSREDRADAISTAARYLLAAGYGVSDLDGVKRTLGAFGVSRNDALVIAAQLADASLAIFLSEMLPFLDFERPDAERCYDRDSPCNPQHRCIGRFPFGVTVEHTETGDGWAVNGTVYGSRVVAELAARKAILLRRLRIEIEESHGNTRVWTL